jgi:co-chaperonin GroES (HSP10)
MIKIKKIKPLFNRVVTTAVTYKEDEVNDGIVDASKAEGAIMEYQTVVSVGKMVTCVKPGDLVVINPTRYAVMKHKEGSLKDGVITDNPILGYNFPLIELDGKPHLFIYDSDIDYIIKEVEEVEDTPIVSLTPEIVS